MKRIVSSALLMTPQVGNVGGVLLLGLGLALGAGGLTAKPKPVPASAALTAAGEKLEAEYSARLAALLEEVKQALPAVDERKRSAYQEAAGKLKEAEAQAAAAQQALGRVNTASALVGHARGKWIGGAEKGIAQAEAALKKATTAAERQAAREELAKWQANKEDGLKALAERQAAYDKAKAEEPELKAANEAAQAALARARDDERSSAKALLSDFDSLLAGDKLDAKLVTCAVLTEATPRGLAEYAQQGPEQAALVDRLLKDDRLMKDMLSAGGAKFGKYGRAMEIFTAIQQASPKAGEGALRRLALATGLEHAVPVPQSNAQDATGAPGVVDPVKRYLHYEKAFLAGELDPAFGDLGAWEYRMVVNCDAPDEVLAWGREMLRNYRPDHILNPDYGWRYVSAVRTEVPYGSQNVKYDLPTLHPYQNIIKNGGVCGRRAFFGRFILRSFGIPTWGVTQHKHAALSHWTPKGWVVNLGAGFPASWWDKDEVPLSGSQFLLETQAREHGPEYLRVLRARWVSRVLGEEAYNDRRKIAGGFWSSMAHCQAAILASTAVSLGPLGQELAEANEPEHKQKAESAAVTTEDRQVVVQDGAIVLPAVAHGKAAGKGMALKGVAGGMQLHCLGGFKTEYELEAPRAGKYALTARVATVQDGQKFRFAAGGAAAPVEVAVPYTIGMWKQTEPVELVLAAGRNVLEFESVPGSRGVTVKEFTLTPVR